MKLVHKNDSIYIEIIIRVQAGDLTIDQLVF